jgi:hypothetical protein
MGESFVVIAGIYQPSRMMFLVVGVTAAVSLEIAAKATFLALRTGCSGLD